LQSEASAAPLINTCYGEDQVRFELAAWRLKAQGELEGQKYWLDGYIHASFELELDEEAAGARRWRWAEHGLQDAFVYSAVNQDASLHRQEILQPLEIFLREHLLGQLNTLEAGMDGLRLDIASFLGSEMNRPSLVGEIEDIYMKGAHVIMRGNFR